MIRKLDGDVPFPRYAALERIVKLFWQHARFRWLPVRLHVHAHLIGLVALFGGEIDVQRLIKPGGGQRLARQVAVIKAEAAFEVMQRTVERFDKQTVIVQRDVARGLHQLAVQRDIKM